MVHLFFIYILHVSVAFSLKRNQFKIKCLMLSCLGHSCADITCVCSGHIDIENNTIKKGQTYKTVHIPFTHMLVVF